MSDKQWSIFKSGSDIRGLALGDVKNPLYLSDDRVYRMICGFSRWLKDKTGKEAEKLTVSVGHDPRLSATRIKKSVIQALTDSGIDVIDCGLSTTPAMFFTTVDLNCDGAVQITASHHPSDKNGLKFFTKAGGLEGADITAILNLADAGGFIEPARKGITKTYDYMSDYSARLRRIILDGASSRENEKPLEGLKIVVDAGNGAGGFYAADVLVPLGADVTGSLFLEPDGSFPNHIPNPESSETMDALLTAVEENEADFGIAFDTDVDRAACVSGGKEINRNRLVALASSLCLEENRGGIIVTDSTTSDGVGIFIREHGGRHLRYKRGYRNVIAKQIELTNAGENCPLAIETSGHASFSSNYFLDDGAYLMTRLIVKLVSLKKEGKRLEDVLSTLQEPAEESELRFRIKTEDFSAYGERVIKSLSSYASTRKGWEEAAENYEGIRISVSPADGGGWFLLRLSVHDPVMVLNAESNEKGGNKRIFAELYGFVKQFEDLDISELYEAL